MDWFRTYSAILNKPRFVKLEPAAIGYWTLFAAAANLHSPRGTLPDDTEELGLMVHRPSGEVAEMIAVLLDVGLLERREDGRLWFHKWSEYQQPSTDRANASKSNKRNTPQHPATNATPSNTQQQPATIATQKRREEKRGEETPLPPGGGPVCVSVEGSEPEPFVPPPPAESPPALPPDVRRMVDGVDKILPGLGYGELCGQQGLEPDVAIGAAIELKASGKTSWSYYSGIYRRLLADKGNGKAPPKPEPPPARLPPPDPADVELARKRNAKAMADAKARREAQA